MKSAVAVAAVLEESPAEIRLAEIQALQVESLEVDRRVGNLRKVGEQRLNQFEQLAESNSALVEFLRKAAYFHRRL